MNSHAPAQVTTMPVPWQTWSDGMSEAMRFDPKNEELIAVDYESVRRFDLRQNKLLNELALGQKHEALASVFSSDGTKLIRIRPRSIEMLEAPAFEVNDNVKPRAITQAINPNDNWPTLSDDSRYLAIDSERERIVIDLETLSTVTSLIC